MNEHAADGTTPCPEAEAVACLADGTWPAPERERLLQHVAECEDCREAWLTAARLRWESEPVARVLPFRSPAAAWALAAALLLLAGGGILFATRGPVAPPAPLVSALDLDATPWARLARNRLGFSAPAAEGAAAWLGIHAASLERGASPDRVRASLERLGLTPGQPLDVASLRRQAGAAAGTFELARQVEAWRIDLARGGALDLARARDLTAAAAGLSLDAPLRRTLEELGCSGPSDAACRARLLERLEALEALLLA